MWLTFRMIDRMFWTTKTYGPLFVLVAGGLIAAGCSMRTPPALIATTRPLASVSAWPGDLLGTRAATMPAMFPTTYPTTALATTTPTTTATTTTAAMNASMNAPTIVRVRVFALAKLTDVRQLTSVGTQARLVTVKRRASPVLSAPQLLLRVRSGTDDVAESQLQKAQQLKPSEMAVLLDEWTALLPGVAVRINVGGDESSNSIAANSSGESLRLTLLRGAEVHSSSDSAANAFISASISMTGLVEVESESGAGPAQTPNTKAADIALIAPLIEVEQTESAILEDVSIETGRQLVFVTPLRLESTIASAVMVAVEFDPADSNQYREEATAATLDLARSQVRVASGAEASSVANRDEWSTYQAIIKNSKSADDFSLRRSLVVLASATQSLYSADFALAADTVVLRRYVELLDTSLAASSNPSSSREPAAMGWLMDRVWLELSSRLLNDGALAPAMVSVLLLHTGQAGRDGASLADVLAVSASRAQWEARLEAENLIYLEDASPAARVRAYEWLTWRKAAPAGFDPLADARIRRDALSTFQNKIESDRIRSPEGGRRE